MRQILQLLQHNKDASAKIFAKAKDGATEVYVSGIIDADWGASAEALRNALPESGDVLLYVNSPGGDVFEARAMAAAIARHNGKVTAIVEGVAASAATYLLSASAEAKAYAGSQIMIHNSWTIALGDKSDLLATAALLEQVDQAIAADYAKLTGKDQADIAAMMDAETWMTAEEALENKFVSEVLDNTQRQAPSNTWNLAAYKNAPKPKEKPAPDEQALAASLRQRNLNRARLAQLESGALSHSIA